MQTAPTATQPEQNLPEHVNRRGCGLGLCLTVDRHGRPIAYRVYRDRVIRYSRAEAEVWISTGQARSLTRSQSGLRPIAGTH